MNKIWERIRKGFTRQNLFGARGHFIIKRMMVRVGPINRMEKKDEGEKSN